MIIRIEYVTMNYDYLLKLQCIVIVVIVIVLLFLVPIFYYE